MTVYSVQFALKNDKYTRDTPQATMITVDVFANNSDEAERLAKAALANPSDFDIEDVVEN